MTFKTSDVPTAKEALCFYRVLEIFFFSTLSNETRAGIVTDKGGVAVSLWFGRVECQTLPLRFLLVSVKCGRIHA